MKNMFRNKKGITLIVLVITVIIMIILASVGIAALRKNKDVRGELLEQDKLLNEFYANSDKIHTGLKDEITEDYEKIWDNYNIVTGEVTDKEDEETEEKMRIGDFVNFDAGTWTEEEVNSIKTGVKGMERSFKNMFNYEPNELYDNFIPTYKFLRLADGESKNGLSGRWRIFDIDNSTGQVTLISENIVEYFGVGSSEGLSGHIAKYILTGVVDKEIASLNVEASYTPRNWSHYASAIPGATAKVFTTTDLENWFNKYLNFKNVNMNYSVFNAIIETRYENLFLPTPIYYQSAELGRSYLVCEVNKTDNYKYSVLEAVSFYYDSWKRGYFTTMYDNFIEPGLRVLVTLPSTVQYSDEKAGTEILYNSDHAAHEFNVWDIVN